MIRRAIQQLAWGGAIALGVAIGIGSLGSRASFVLPAQSAPPAAAPGPAHLFHPQGWYPGLPPAGDNPAAPNTTSLPTTIFSPTDNLPPGIGALAPGTVMRSTKVFLIFWTPNNTIS